MNNPNFVQANLSGPPQQNASCINPSSSKRSFVTETSDSDHDLSMISNKSEKRKISPVFNDYGTAHSLITSGKAKNLTSPERDRYRRRSDDSSSDSTQQLMLMDKRNEKLASNVQFPPVAASEGEFENGKIGVLKGGEDEDDGKIQIPQAKTHPSSSLHENVRHGVLKWEDDDEAGSKIGPLHDGASRIKRPQTPLVPKIWSMKFTDSANRLPLAGGPLSSVQWPSNNPYNEHSPYNRLSRRSSGILSPVDDGAAKEIYSASLYGSTKKPFYSSPHGIPSPMASKSGSGSSGEPRSRYYPVERMRVDDHGSDAHFGDNHMQKNFVYDGPTHYSQQHGSRYSRSVPENSDGSTVNHILDHYTQDLDGSYYGDGAKTTTAHTHQTPTSSRRFDQAKHGSGAVTPSTDEDAESSLVLRKFPNVPSPAYIGSPSSGNINYSSYGDSHELLGTDEQSERPRDSMLAPPPLAPKSILRGRRLTPADLGRQVSNALRDSTMYDDSFVEVSSPVIKKPVVAKTKLQLRDRKPIDGFLKVKADSSGNSSDGDGAVCDQESSENKENIPPTSNYTHREITSDRFAEDFRVETFRREGGEVIRKISRRKAPVVEEDDQEDWVTMLEEEESSGASPNAKIPFPQSILPAYKQAGSSIANVSDYYKTSSPGAAVGPYAVSQRAVVHPSRGHAQFDKHARPIQGGLPGLGHAYLPVPEQRLGGGFATNAFRSRGKIMRTLSNHLSSPLVSSSPRHEYYELGDTKKGASSPYSPPNGKGKTPMRHEAKSEVAAREDGARPRPPTTAWMDGPKSIPGSEGSAAGFQFGLNQRPERPDSYTQMARAANDGKLPKFMMPESSLNIPAPEGESYNKFPQPYAQPYPETPRIIYPPPAIHSTSESIADYSDDEVSYIDSLNGPEYDNPTSSPYNRQNDPRLAASNVWPAPESAYVDRSEVSQKPLEPDGFNSLITRYNSKRRKARFARVEAARADFEAQADPDVITIPQDTRKLRAFKLRPSIVKPRSHHEFQYRSPLAPIQSKTWEPLYTERKLNRINNLRAHTEVVRPAVAHVTLRGTRMTGTNSWQIAPVSPHLQGHQHEDSSFGGFAEQKEKISNFVLVVCSLPVNPLLPFLLLMYATGLLDWAINWHTKGDIRGFGRKQKKLAAIILGAVAAAAVLATVVILVVKARQEGGH